MHIGTTARTPAGLAEISIISGGVPQPLYRHPAGGRIFTPGIQDVTYTLRVRNLTTGRVEVITTVDGRNTLKDEPGDVQQNRGLIIPAHQAAEFTGWRIDDNTTRAFVFGPPQSSVAARATGTAANTGVIGFAVYREHVREQYVNLRSAGTSYATAAPFFGAATMDWSMTNDASGGGVQSRSLGTGIGEARTDHVGRTGFSRAYGTAPDVLAIGYETEDVLRAQGLLGPAEPDAFPGTGTGYEKYVTP